MGKINNLTGQRFGRWVVLREAGRTSDRRVKWLCQCDCGRQSVVSSSELKSGRSRSCGCLKSQLLADRNRSIGQGNWVGEDARLYSIWYNMKRRCANKSCRQYKDYGGRGITVCYEWRNDFATFRDWAQSHGYQDKLTIDRIDNNLGYSPENCRWVTLTVQERNRRNNRRLSFRGETHVLSEWAEITGINIHTLYGRIAAGWPVERALTEPVNKTK